jgi:hypothetical protein
MEIIREFKKPTSRQIVLDIPEKFVEKITTIGIERIAVS